MSNAALTAFSGFFKEIKKLPFPEQQAAWGTAAFSLDDFGKRFPPAATKVFCDLFGTLDKEINFDIREKLVLEVGPGFNFGVGLLAALSGAKKVFAVDAYPHTKGADHDFILAMLASLLEERSFFFSGIKGLSDDDFTNHIARHVATDKANRFHYRKDKLELLFPYYAEKLPFKENAFDLIYTSAAFEHFLRPRQAVQEMYRVTKPGGISLHSVDLRDHRNFQKPLDFLALSDEQWLQVFKEKNNSSYSHTNRLRSSEIVSLFEEQGFKTLKVLPMPFVTCTVKDELYRRMTDHYKKISQDELGILGCKYIFRK